MDGEITRRQFVTAAAALGISVVPGCGGGGDAEAAVRVHRGPRFNGSMAGYGYMMGNLTQTGAANIMHIYSNRVESSRGFCASGTAIYGTPMDANGWPTSNCDLVLSAGTDPNGGNLMTGITYLMQWTGATTALPDSGSGFTITNKVYNAGTNTTTAQMTISSNTTIIIPITVPMTNLVVIPQALGLSYASRWDPDAITYMKQFSGLRYMKCGAAEWDFLDEDNYTLTWSGGGMLCFSPGTATVSIASPCVVTKSNHGFAAGATVAFSTTGALPTGLSAGVTYYVLATGLTTNTFQVSTTPGGAAVNTSGTQSGTHTLGALSGTFGTLSNGGASPCVFNCLYGASVVIAGVNQNTSPGMSISRTGYAANLYQIYSRTTGTGPSYNWIPMRVTTTWAQRPSVNVRSAAGSVCRETVGMPIDDQISLSNELYAASGSKFKTGWFHVHHTADDGWVTSMATALRDTLNPGIKIIIEFSNETWNSIFYESYWMQYWQASAEVGGNPASELNYDSSGVATVWRRRFHARRFRQVALIFQTVFGADFGVRCRMTLAGQSADYNSMIDMLEFLRANYPEAPSSYTHLISPASYTATTNANVAAASDVPTLVGYLTNDASQGTSVIVTQAATWCEIAAVFGVGGVACYEGGPSITQSATSVVQAAMDSADIQTHIEDLVHQINAHGVHEFCYYNIGVGQPYTNYTTGNAMWHCTTSMTVPSHKLQAVQNLLAWTATAKDSIISRHAAPGSVSPILNSATAHVRTDTAVAGNALLAWTSLGNVGWNASTVGVARWIDYAFYAATTKTYTITPSIAAHGTGTFRLLMDGAQIWNSGAATTGTRPSTNAAVSQTPFTLSITQGWHSLRMECTPATTGEQYGFGPCTFA